MTWNRIIQALRLSSEVYGGYVKVEEYNHGHHMKVVYWRPGSDQLLSAFLLDTSESESHDQVLPWQPYIAVKLGMAVRV